MSISKYLIIRDDKKRLSTAFFISVLLFSPALLDISVFVFKQPQAYFSFEQTKNSLFQQKTPNTIGNLNPERVDKVISAPHLLTQRSSKVKLFTRANKTEEKITPDLIETEKTENEVTNNLSQESSTESKRLVGAVTEAIQKQDFILSPAPSYPLEARQQSVQGSAELKISIQPSGAVSMVKVLKSSGSPVLDQEAVSTLYKWIYKSDRNIQSEREYKITIEFILDELELPLFRQNVSVTEPTSASH